jgi:hypothetical protein
MEFAKSASEDCPDFGKSTLVKERKLLLLNSQQQFGDFP